LAASADERLRQVAWQQLLALAAAPLLVLVAVLGLGLPKLWETFWVAASLAAWV
jgi:hypothetical protein